MRYINVVGVSGSGKTTLAKKIADKFGYEHIELDKLHWKEDWQAYGKEDFQEKIHEFMDLHHDGWVIDGYYGNKQGDRPWEDADTIIYLDIPLRLVQFRLAKRSILRKLRRQLVWGTNREKLRHFFDLQKSVRRWYPHTKKQMEEFADNIPEGTEYHHFTSSKQANEWLSGL